LGAAIFQSATGGKYPRYAIEFGHLLFLFPRVQVSPEMLITHPWSW